MPKLRDVDPYLVEELLAASESVVTHAELVEAGLPLSTVVGRIQRTGRWQRLHPGVVLAHSGTPTRRERLLGALAYAGQGAVLTGICALRLHGLRAAAGDDRIHVIISHERHRQSRDGVTVVRTRAVPEHRLRHALPVASVARCVIDACRELPRLGDVREVVAEAVQSGACTVAELQEALATAARQRSALTREVLAEVDAGVRSAAEARVRVVFRRHRIRQPQWNWSLHDLTGRHLVTPDGYWSDIGAALQVDSMAWHLSPARYRRTQHLQRVLSRYDVPFLPVAPGDVFADEAGFIRMVSDFLRTHARHQPNPELLARPPRARGESHVR